MIVHPAPSATHAWLHVLDTIFDDGLPISPRGMRTLEVPHNSAAFQMRHPVAWSPARKLSYKFMAAEALWILSGDDTVAGIAPYNKRIADFSDDGVTFFGAYGPRFVEQFEHVVDSLVRDRDSRQAVSSIWRPNPPSTKDVPCTLSLTFEIRDDRLNVHAFMRSSDAWLGLPYDFFNFAAIGLRVATEVNRIARPAVDPGIVFWTAVSSHLYYRNRDGAKAVRAEAQDINHVRAIAAHDRRTRVPIEAVRAGDWKAVETELVAAREANVRPFLTIGESSR